MKKEHKAILISLVLGDGYVRVDQRYPKKGHLSIRHSVKQREYVEYKRDLLHSIIGGKDISLRETKCTLFNKTFKQICFDKSHKYFKVLRNWMYPNKYTTNILNKLTPQAIAIWYMDDGSLVVNNRYKDGTCSSARTNIHTCCKERSIAEDICKYFKNTWDIKFTPFSEKGTFSIRCFHEEGKKFHALIHEFIIPSMLYKQRFYYNTST